MESNSKSFNLTVTIEEIENQPLEEYNWLGQGHVIKIEGETATSYYESEQEVMIDPVYPKDHPEWYRKMVCTLVSLIITQKFGKQITVRFKGE